jgi:1-deoxy-D-xylulose-5-phosphate reductoisomerase
MKGAIAYSLSYPERLPIGLPVPDFPELACLHFEAPDMEKFSCLALAFQAARQGNTFPAVLNAANEIAVQAFLDERIAFTGISDVVRRTLDAHEPAASMTLETIIEADGWARRFAAALTEKAHH